MGEQPEQPALTYIVACDEPGWFGDEEGEWQCAIASIGIAAERAEAQRLLVVLILPKNSVLKNSIK